MECHEIEGCWVYVVFIDWCLTGSSFAMDAGSASEVRLGI